MIRCNQCGTLHTTNTLFCDECGNRLSPDEVVAARKTPDARAQDRPLAVDLSTSDGQKHFHIMLEQQALIGRKDESTSTLPDVDLAPAGGQSAGVSRRHARLVRQGASVFVEDLNSMNGTYLRGQRLPANSPQRVERDDELQFGKVVLRIQF